MTRLNVVNAEVMCLNGLGEAGDSALVEALEQNRIRSLPSAIMLKKI